MDIVFSYLPFIDFLILDYFWKTHNNLLQWIVTNIFWALIVLFFIDTFVKDKEQEKEVENIKKQIKRFDSLTQLLFQKYIQYTHYHN